MVRGVCQRESTFDTDPRPVPAVLPLIRGRAEPSVTAPLLDIYKPITDTSLSGRHPRPHPFSHPLLSLNSSSNLQSFAIAATTATHSLQCRSLGAPSCCSHSLPSQRLPPREPSRLPLATSPASKRAASGHPMVRYLSSASMPARDLMTIIRLPLSFYHGPCAQPGGRRRRRRHRRNGRRRRRRPDTRRRRRAGSPRRIARRFTEELAWTPAGVGERLSFELVRRGARGVWTRVVGSDGFWALSRCRCRCRTPGLV